VTDSATLQKLIALPTNTTSSSPPMNAIPKSISMKPHRPAAC